MVQIKALACQLVPILFFVVFAAESATILALLPVMDFRNGLREAILLGGVRDVTRGPGRVERLNIRVWRTFACFCWNKM